MSYHVAVIEKGVLGEVSKIQEELDELKDAMVQENYILALCELADMYGAMEAFLAQACPGVSMYDLALMAEATKRSFDSGERKSND